MTYRPPSTHRSRRLPSPGGMSSRARLIVAAHLKNEKADTVRLHDSHHTASAHQRVVMHNLVVGVPRVQGYRHRPEPAALLPPPGRHVIPPPGRRGHTAREHGAGPLTHGCPASGMPILADRLLSGRQLFRCRPKAPQGPGRSIVFSSSFPILLPCCERFVGMRTHTVR